MVSETVIGAMIGVGGATVGSLLIGGINWLTTQQQLQSAEKRLEQRIGAENERRRAEFYLQPKVNSLTSLHSVLNKCRHKYRIAADYKTRDMSKEDLRAIINCSIEYRDAMDSASAFLDDERMAKIEKFYDKLIDANTYFGEVEQKTKANEWPVEVSDWAEEKWDRREFFEAHEEAQKVLKEELHEPIERLEPN